MCCSDELNRKENSGLKNYVDKLAKAKKAIDSRSATVGRCTVKCMAKCVSMRPCPCVDVSLTGRFNELAVHTGLSREAD